MTKRHCRAKTKSCLKFSVVALSILVAGTALGNQVSAAEVHPTISTQSPIISDEVKDVASGLRSKVVNFVKEGLEKSTSQNKYDFLGTNSTTIKKNEVIKIETGSTIFTDMENNPDRYYVENLAKNGIISKSEKFYPNNFIRLNEVSKMFVNAYRFKVGYDMDSNAGLTDNVYFDTIVPKYYNTAYEMGLLNGVENVEDYERFVTYYDLNKILKNFKTQYPDLVNMYYMDIVESDANLKRGEVAKTIFKTMVIDSNIVYSYDDIAYNEYGGDIQLLADNGIIESKERFYPEEEIARKDYIVWLVKTHLKHLGEHVDSTELYESLSDLDYGSDYATYLLYAKNEGRIDYLVETVRGQDYIHPDEKLTKHEAYYIISKVTGVEFDYDIISADKVFITRGEVAKLLTTVYNLQETTKMVSSTNYENDSHIGRLIENIKGIANGGKKLAFVS